MLLWCAGSPTVQKAAAEATQEWLHLNNIPTPNTTEEGNNEQEKNPVLGKATRTVRHNSLYTHTPFAFLSALCSHVGHGADGRRDRATLVRQKCHAPD